MADQHALARKRMRRILKTSATALMLTCTGGNVWAATVNSAGCASSEEMFAVRAAAVQQRLMVAAFSCHAIKLYNRFVTTYQKDLQVSDHALQNFFRRLDGSTGTADYHSFKTRLANTASIQSSRDPQSYCASAQKTFDAALANKKTSLPVFLAGQTTAVDHAFSPCQVLTASSNKTLRRQ
jgi:hypothetical protein